MNAPNLESLFEHFDYEIDNVCSKLALLDYYNEHDREECIQLNSSLGNIQYIIHETNKLIENAFEELEEKKKRCQQLYELLEDQADYIVNNIPTQSTKPMNAKSRTYTNLNAVSAHSKTKNTDHGRTNTGVGNGQSAKQSETKKNIQKAKPKIETSEAKSAPKSDAKVVAKDSESKFAIAHLDLDDYKSIPTYMIGRFTLINLNEYVDAFNLAINSKYSFIKKFDVQSSKEADYRRFQHYKMEENADTKGQYFVTVADIKELAHQDNVSALRKALVILRHCKRIREIRGNPPKLIRYALI